MSTVASLTEIGKEVMKLCDVRSNHEYLLAVAKTILSKGFDVKTADISKLEDGIIHFENSVTLT